MGSKSSQVRDSQRRCLRTLCGEHNLQVVGKRHSGNGLGPIPMICRPHVCKRLNLHWEDWIVHFGCHRLIVVSLRALQATMQWECNMRRCEHEQAPLLWSMPRPLKSMISQFSHDALRTASVVGNHMCLVFVGRLPCRTRLFAGI